MKIISEASESVLTILKKFPHEGAGTRWLQYCVLTPIEDGMLVFNMLTREMVLLTSDEHNHFSENDYLRQRWFVVSEGTQEKKYADFVKWILEAQKKKPKRIAGYTIFTTTDCNARCFYCFELGRSRIPMSCDTAEKVVQYIKNHCGGKDVSISWFGGEPLYNVEVIDIIAEGLHREGIGFRSRMVSNGYLFDDEIVHRAVERWNLKKIQITLDGTEKVYNKIKAFIYRDTNAFEIVMANIGRLLDAGVKVSIRLNMDLYNAEDLLKLAEDLARRFAGKKGISVYAHHLFEAGTPNAELHSEEEWEKREKAMQRINEVLDQNGLRTKSGITKKIKLDHCMADCGKAVTILPNGDIGLCEHYTETEFIGHIDREEFDAQVVDSWKARTPEIPECSECFYFLDCIMLKKCSSSSVCYRQFREEMLQNTQRSMVYEYEKWQAKANPEENDDDEDDILC